MEHSKNFCVGSVSSLLAFTLPEPIQTFMRRVPECNLRVTSLHSIDSYNYIRNNSADMAFITDSMFSTQVRTCLLFREQLVLCAGKNLKLPARVSVSDLDTRHEVRTPWDRNNFDPWHNYYFGTSSVPRIQVDEMTYLQYFLQSGNTWSFLPYSIAVHLSAQNPIEIKELTVQPPQRSVYYLYNPQRVSAFQKQFLAIVRDYLAGVPGITLAEENEEAAEALTPSGAAEA